MSRLILFLAFVGVPLAEIALFVIVGDQIGVLATVGVVIATAIIGTALLRRQGLSVLARARGALDEGRMPVDEVAEGLFLLVAGLLLLTPGFLTDAIGFALFVPAIRRPLGRGILGWLVASGRMTMTGGRMGSGFRPGPAGPRRGRGGGAAAPGKGPIIEGEAVDVSPRPPDAGDGDPRIGRAGADSPWREDRE